MAGKPLSNAFLLWFCYILLIAFSCSLFINSLSVLALVLVLAAYVMRYNFRQSQKRIEEAHCTWLANSIWLVLLLGIAALICVLIVGGWMSSDPLISSRIDNLLSQPLEPQALLREMFSIPGIKTMVGIVLVVGWLLMVWPLKRALHGIFALRAGVAPSQLGGRRWLALVLAVVAQGCLSGILLDL